MKVERVRVSSSRLIFVVGKELGRVQKRGGMERSEERIGCCLHVCRTLVLVVWSFHGLRLSNTRVELRFCRIMAATR